MMFATIREQALASSALKAKKRLRRSIAILGVTGLGFAVVVALVLTSRSESVVVTEAVAPQLAGSSVSILITKADTGGITFRAGCDTVKWQQETKVDSVGTRTMSYQMHDGTFQTVMVPRGVSAPMIGRAYMFIHVTGAASYINAPVSSCITSPPYWYAPNPVVSGL